MVRDTHVEAVVARVLHTAGELGRVPHHFLWHAADVHARAAEPAGFEQRDASAVFSRPLCGGETAAAAAEHDQIELPHMTSDTHAARIPYISLLAVRRVRVTPWKMASTARPPHIKIRTLTRTATRCSQRTGCRSSKRCAPSTSS